MYACICVYSNLCMRTLHTLQSSISCGFLYLCVCAKVSICVYVCMDAYPAMNHLLQVSVSVCVCTKGLYVWMCV